FFCSATPPEREDEASIEIMSLPEEQEGDGGWARRARAQGKAKRQDNRSGGLQDQPPGGARYFRAEPFTVVAAVGSADEEQDRENDDHAGGEDAQQKVE